MAEGAVKAEPMKLCAVFVNTRNAINIEQDVRARVHRVREIDGLVGRLIEPKYRKRKIKPRRDHENGDGNHDTGDGQSTGRDDRNQHLHPGWYDAFT